MMLLYYYHPVGMVSPSSCIPVYGSIFCGVDLSSLMHLIVGRRRVAGCPASYSGLHDYPSLIENKFHNDLVLSLVVLN
jgi:hypothetical protein